MGFPERFDIPVSDTRAYQQLGNSVVVPVIEAVARSMIGAMEFPVPAEGEYLGSWTPREQSGLNLQTSGSEAFADAL
jgi:C-5 cytosine-specific DNA methylase